jgi:hypothetical protein
LKDEVLQKALSADTTVIPRYDIILPDGTKFAENVQLVLKNVVLTEGTPLNRQTLLKDATAVLYGLNATNALPDDVFLAVRNSASYCPKLNIYSVPGATIELQKANVASTIATYTVPTSGVLTVDILSYGTYRVCATISGTRTLDKFIDISETKQYSVEVFSYVTYVKCTVTQEVGATITAIHTDGSVANGVVGADKTCIIALYKTGLWSFSAEYEGTYAQTTAINPGQDLEGKTSERSPAWTKIVVNTTSGATVTISKSGVTKSAISVNGSCTFWVPASTDTWSIAASLNNKHGSGFTAPTSYGTKTVTISLS